MGPLEEVIGFLAIRLNEIAGKEPSNPIYPHSLLLEVVSSQRVLPVGSISKLIQNPRARAKNPTARDKDNPSGNLVPADPATNPRGKANRKRILDSVRYS